MNLFKKHRSPLLLLTLTAFPLVGCQGGNTGGSGFSDPIRTTGPLNAPRVATSPAEVPGIKPEDTRASKPQTSEELEKTLGIPLYPGATTPTDNGTPLSISGGVRFQLHVLETADPVEKVKAFYLNKLPNAKPGPPATDPKEPVAILASGDDGYLRSVEIEQQEGKTRITLTRMSEPEMKSSQSDAPPSLPGGASAGSGLPPVEPATPSGGSTLAPR